MLEKKNMRINGQLFLLIVSLRLVAAAVAVDGDHQRISDDKTKVKRQRFKSQNGESNGEYDYQDNYDNYEYEDNESNSSNNNTRGASFVYFFY